MSPGRNEADPGLGMQGMGTFASKWRKAGALVRSNAVRWTTVDRVPIFIRPCYWIRHAPTRGEVVADCGLGFDADFSLEMIRRFGVVSHGFDPTEKHQPQLATLASELGGALSLHSVAVGAHVGRATFHESRDNVSGSIEPGHVNVERDALIRYEVEVVTIGEVIERAGGAVALVKLDIEGSEYEALAATPDSILEAVPQWIIEFHHDVIRNGSYSETRRAVRRFERIGFRSFSTDAVNFSFWRH